MRASDAKGRTLVGVDFDNTIVSYDEVFHATAVKRGLVAESCPVSKEAVRDHLRTAGREEQWTRLQGYVYGPGMEAAKPFPGALEFFERARARSLPVVVISHRTRRPYLGEPHDLHAAAQRWLEQHRLGVAAYFELTKQEKLERIASVGCTHFVDDLPEFLAEPGFPVGVTRILFDPQGSEQATRLPGSVRPVRSWAELANLMVGG